MIKKIFKGILLAVVFGLLILGAVNRTIAKATEKEPEYLNNQLAIGEGRNGNNQQEPEDFPEETILGRGQAQKENDVNGEDTYRQGRQSTGDGAALGYANVEDWLADTGVVDSVEPSLWIITLSDGTIVEVEGRALSYLAEINFVVNAGDSVSLTGFFENGEFKLGQIENTTTGTLAVVRDENGYPMWSGGRR